MISTNHTDVATAPALLDRQAHWQQRLDDLAKANNIPGVQVGILRMGPDGADELLELCHGVLNLNTGVPVTSDSVFQIGSISKVWTTSVVMHLVDEGLLDLDTPIIELLPELRLADPDTQAGLTMRHLVTHTSGIDGDLFTDTGRGDDVLERFVALLPDLVQLFPLGESWSYCNAGFVLAGRVIEAVTGLTWDVAMRKFLFEPLGLPNTVTLPEEALLRRAAVGHVAGPDGQPIRIPTWNVPRSIGPAGGIMSTAADVLAFARMHMAGGAAADGTQVLAPETVLAMQAKQASLPAGVGGGEMDGSSWGFGWLRFQWDGSELVGHNGGTWGQAAALRLLPAQGLAVVFLANGGEHDVLFETLSAELFAELASIDKPTSPTEPPAASVRFDPAEYVGVYTNVALRGEVVQREQGLSLRISEAGGDEPDAALEIALFAESEDVFLMTVPPDPSYIPVQLAALASGRRFLHLGGRMLVQTTG
ncbi:MAG: beta-lactamase family protein [Actinomycetota bacterium]|nr:beta-lactamase family protein [Actinomycetota bacterium]